jgi:large subunit ribosomal protein L21
MYAIIEDSGTQFKVTEGDRIRIDRAFDENEKTVKFDRVLLVAGGGDNQKPRLGNPLVGGPKITKHKYTRRKGYHRKIGHRQHYTEVKITGITV